MRPDQPWGDVVRVLNREQAGQWTVERLRRTVRRLVGEGIVEASLLDRAGRSGATIGWSGWSPASRPPHPTARCSRLRPNSKPCANARRAVARAGTPPPSSTCWSGRIGSD